MGYQYWKYDKLNSLCNDAFQKFGFNAEEAKIITDVLLMSDRFGIESHGMQRMYRYYKSIQKGMIKVKSKGKVVFETPVSAVLDAEDGMGQVVGYKAMQMAIEKAKKVGMAMVTVRNSNHYGIAGYYAKLASDQGLIGMSFTNISSLMRPLPWLPAVSWRSTIRRASLSTTVGHWTRTVILPTMQLMFWIISQLRMVAVSCLWAAAPRIPAAIRATVMP